MTWKVRHEGSPRSVDDLTPEQVAEGLRDGLWEPTDEVMGPDDPDWVPIESHPLLEEAAADVEPPPAPEHDDETRLDMNALIDVTLVLLVFFILTTTYATLQARLEAPTVSRDKDTGVVVLTKKQVDNQMILVSATMQDGEPVIRVEDKVVEPERLTAELRKFVRDTGKTVLLLKHDDDVPHDTVVKIIDAAKGAGMDSVKQLLPDRGRPRKK
jgi:biopolymer transport protein ExbD